MQMTKDDMRTLLLGQILQEHSKAQTMRLVRWVGHDEERLEVLMGIFLNDPPIPPLPEGRGYAYLFTQRSAWALRYIGENAPNILAKWLPILVAQLQVTPIHDAIKRNVLNVLEGIDFPEALDGVLAEQCFGYLSNPKEAIAIRCASMTILSKICTRVPELSVELRLLLEEILEHTESAGVRSRAGRVLKGLG